MMDGLGWVFAACACGVGLWQSWRHHLRVADLLDANSKLLETIRDSERKRLSAVRDKLELEARLEARRR